MRTSGPPASWSTIARIVDMADDFMVLETSGSLFRRSKTSSVTVRAILIGLLGDDVGADSEVTSS